MGSDYAVNHEEKFAFFFLGGGGGSIIVNGVIRFNSIVGRAQHNVKSNAIGHVIMLYRNIKENFPKVHRQCSHYTTKRPQRLHKK